MSSAAQLAHGHQPADASSPALDDHSLRTLLAAVIGDRYASDDRLSLRAVLALLAEEFGQVVFERGMPPRGPTRDGDRPRAPRAAVRAFSRGPGPRRRRACVPGPVRAPRPAPAPGPVGLRVRRALRLVARRRGRPQSGRRVHARVRGGAVRVRRFGRALHGVLLAATGAAESGGARRTETREQAGDGEGTHAPRATQEGTGRGGSGDRSGGCRTTGGGGATRPRSPVALLSSRSGRGRVGLRTCADR